MKFSHKLAAFIFLLLLPALACSTDTPVSTPQVSTATAPPAELEEVEAAVPETDEQVPEPDPTAEPEPTTAPTDTPEPAQEANLGDLVEQEGYSLVAVTVEDPAPAGLLYTPTEGTKLVAVEVVIGNVSGERVTVNALSSTLVDSDGFAHQAELAGRDGQIDLVDLKPGERVKGWIAFEIPEDVTPNIFKYEVSSFPSISLETKLTTADGMLMANSDVPLTATGEVQRDVPGNLGDLIESDGYSLVAEAVEDPTTPGILYTPVEGTKLIAVQIAVGNVSGEVVTINALNATLVDTEGYVYTAELGGRDEQIDLIDINPGERARGWVSFQIPEGATPESIIYLVTGFPIVELQAGLSE
jgi:hypothetical protein